MHSLSFNFSVPGKQVSLRPRDSLLDQSIRVERDQICILRMHHHQRSQLFASAEDLEKSFIRLVQRTALISHEDFEGLNSFFDYLLHFLGDLLIPVSNCAVEGVVYVDFRICSPPPILICGHQPLFPRNYKVNEGSSPSSSCCLRPLVKVVNRCCSHERHLQVAVGIYASWDDELAFGVNGLDVGGQGSFGSIGYHQDILPPSNKTSALNWFSALTTVPPLMSRGVGPVAEEKCLSPANLREN
eukprot:CAMPEP_0202960274 /NCGR_PEP_ID=MMETSP1396-20130829/4420_1 /ASSEMBLY_ACC=CAM_ASM_000872 /TAXON_ID= /ORGANISM="Pseudokeronopsis sp., Strain Brazil" /LENGTH=242 /DNA_ID=CAMNT_0049679389 /DNA_START=2091 /DNA_END=2817 /DNA_ORIENTATION=-